MSSLHCTACGIEAKANCNCGKPYGYMQANKAGALALAAHPEWSDHKLAEKTGVCHMTIGRLRRSTGTNVPVEKREGRDGRKRSVDRKARRQRIADSGNTDAKAIAAEEGLGPRVILQDLERNREDQESFERGRLFERENPDLSRIPLTKAQQKKLDDGARAYQRQLEAQFETVVLREMKRRVDEYVAPRFFERERDADRCRQFTRRKGLFKKEEYNVILRCVHPDRTASIEEKNEAFRLLHENRLLLLSEKDDPRTYPPIPTADEFMAGIKRPFRKSE